MKELQDMLATFVENGCYVETPEGAVTLFKWLENHNYIPVGKIKLKHANDDKRDEEQDAYGDLFRKFHANYAEPFNRVLFYCLQEAAGEEIKEFVTGYTDADEMEIRVEA